MTPIQRAMVESDKTIPDYHLIDCHFSGCKDRIYHTLEHFTRCVISRGWDAAEAGRLWEERLGRDRRRISVAGPPPEPAAPIEPSAASPLDALLISERRRVAAAARHVVRPPEPQVSGSAGSFTAIGERAAASVVSRGMSDLTAVQGCHRAADKMAKAQAAGEMGPMEYMPLHFSDSEPLAALGPDCERWRQFWALYGQAEFPRDEYLMDRLRDALRPYPDLDIDWVYARISDMMPDQLVWPLDNMFRQWEQEFKPPEPVGMSEPAPNPDDPNCDTDETNSCTSAYLTAIETGRWVGKETSYNWVLPGHDPHYESCGNFRTETCDKSSEPLHKGKDVTRRVFHKCGRISCDVATCFKSAMGKEADRGTRRLVAGVAQDRSVLAPCL